MESLVTIAEGDELLMEKSIKTPVFDGDFENHIICGGGNDLLSDGHNDDNSCLMMLEKEW